MELSIAEPWIRIFAIAVGLVSCFWGYPIFRVLLILTGLFHGYALVHALFPASYPLLSILTGVVVAIVLAILVYPFWSATVAIIGAALGAMIFSELGLVLSLGNLGVGLLALGGAVVFGFLFFYLRDLFVMVATAYNGAVLVVLGLGLFHSAFAVGPGKANFLAALAIVLLGSTGLVTQYRMFKDRRQYA